MGNKVFSRGYQGRVMTKRQFEKFRPKKPKICKNDPRRYYTAAFVAAYNTCNFAELLNFVRKIWFTSNDGKGKEVKPTWIFLISS